MKFLLSWERLTIRFGTIVEPEQVFLCPFRLGDDQARGVSEALEICVGTAVPGTTTRPYAG